MFPAVKKQIDSARLLADLTAAKVELLSAQGAADRIRLQYSPQDIVAFGERQTLKRAIASAEALHAFLVRSRPKSSMRKMRLPGASEPTLLTTETEAAFTSPLG